MINKCTIVNPDCCNNILGYKRYLQDNGRVQTYTDRAKEISSLMLMPWPLSHVVMDVPIKSEQYSITWIGNGHVLTSIWAGMSSIPILCLGDVMLLLQRVTTTTVLLLTNGLSKLHRHWRLGLIIWYCEVIGAPQKTCSQWCCLDWSIKEEIWIWGYPFISNNSAL